MRTSTPGTRIRDAVAREFGGVPPNDIGDSFFPVPPDYSDASVVMTGSTAAQRVPQQVGPVVLGVTFTAAGGNSGPVLVQRGLGPAGAVAPPFDGAAFSVPAGQHFSAEGPAERWWTKAPANGDVLTVTARRLP